MATADCKFSDPHISPTPRLPCEKLPKNVQLIGGNILHVKYSTVVMQYNFNEDDEDDMYDVTTTLVKGKSYPILVTEHWTQS